MTLRQIKRKSNFNLSRVLDLEQSYLYKFNCANWCKRFEIGLYILSVSVFHWMKSQHHTQVRYTLTVGEINLDLETNAE